MHHRVHYRMRYCLLLGYCILRNVAAAPSTRVTLTSLVTCPLHPTLAASLYTLNNKKDFDRYVKDNKCRFILTVSTRSLYKYYLENPTAKVCGIIAKERQNDWNAKSAAIAGYLL